MEIEKFSNTEEEFNHFYESDINHYVNDVRQTSDEINVARKRHLIRFFTVGILLNALAVVSAYDMDSIMPLLILNIILYTVYLLKSEKHKREILNVIKEGVVPQLINKMNPNLYYDAIKRINNSDIDKSNLFVTPDYLYGDDYVDGKVGDTRIRFSEVNMKKRMGNDRTVQVFHGLFFIIDFNKDFSGEVHLIPRNYHNSLINRVVKKRQIQELDNGSFNKLFTVYSNDGHLSRYLLTPALMEKVINYIDKTTIMPIISFRDGTMYVGLNTSEEFIGLNNKGEINKEQVVQYFRDLNLSLQLIDELSLNLRIWNKK